MVTFSLPSVTGDRIFPTAHPRPDGDLPAADGGAVEARDS
jgi:hypothetical protein